MSVTTLLADPTAVHLKHIVSSEKSLTLVVKAVRQHAECPRCQQATSRIHSRYVRRVADLPWHGVAVRLELQTRRFRCSNSLCQQTIFCERLPQTVARYARHTARLTDAPSLIGFAIAGKAGARTAVKLGMNVSADTLLRRIRRAPLSEHPPPRVIGVDDWAQRKGTSYGTILVDLERRRPIDLLPDREAATLATWLRAHPGIEIISRDRACAYSEGARDGAPSAVQVADRWHLLKNMGDTLQRVVDRKHAALRQAAKSTTASAPVISIEDSTCPAPAPVIRLTLPEQAKQHSRERRLARYTEVIALWKQGVTVRRIARQLHLSRTTIKKLVAAGEFPEKAQASRRRSIVDPYGEHLAARWNAGCHSATLLWRELQTQGVRGSYNAVCRYLARFTRDNLPLGLQRRKQSQPVTTIKTPSARRTTWLLLRDEAQRQPDEHAFVTRLLDECPEVKTAHSLAQQFGGMIRERKADRLAAWMKSAVASGLPEMRGFVTGLERDVAAVTAALTYEWSNGQVEGQVNRLKLIKRTMYGRAKLDLLRQRVVHTV